MPEFARIITDELVDEFDRIFNSSVIQSFRVLEILIKLGCRKESNLSSIVESRFSFGKKIDSFLAIDNPDLLAKLNCIELVTCLVETQHGLDYMESRGHLKSLLDVLIGVNQNPLADLLVPAIVKLFAVITKTSKQSGFVFYSKNNTLKIQI